MAKISVKNEHFNCIGTKVEIDGKKIDRVKSVDFSVAVDEIPQFTIGMFAMPDIEMQGRCDFGFDVETIQQACKVLVQTLKTNEEFYNAFVASIESALRESTIVWEEWEYTETAKKIADRIIGNETT